MKRTTFVLWTIVIFMTCNKAYGQILDTNNPNKRTTSVKIFSSIPIDSTSTIDTTAEFLHFDVNGNQIHYNGYQSNIGNRWNNGKIDNFIAMKVVISSGSYAQPVAKRYSSGHWIVTNDTLALERMYQATIEINKQFIESLTERNLLLEIVSYLNRDGSITNLKRYKAACDAYIRWQKRGKL